MNGIRWFVILVAVLTAQDTKEAMTDLEQGAKTLANINSYLSHGTYGYCHQTLIENLGKMCYPMDEHRQAYLAFHLLRCFLLRSRQQQPDCGDEDDLDVCLGKLDQHYLILFSDFWGQAFNACRFLLQSTFEVSTQFALQNISRSTINIKNEVDDARRLQQQMVKNQHVAMIQQQRLRKDHKSIQNGVRTAHDLLINLLKSIKEVTNEETGRFFILMKKLSDMQHYLIFDSGRWSDIYHYVLAFAMIMLATLFRQTAHARGPLILLLLVQVGVEYVVDSEMLLENQFMHNMHESEIILHEKKTTMRRGMILIGIIMLIYYLLFHQDKIDVNQKLIRQMMIQNREERRLILNELELIRRTQMVQNDIFYEVEEDLSTNDDELEYDSGQSDHSYYPLTGSEDNSEESNDEQDTTPEEITFPMENVGGYGLRRRRAALAENVSETTTSFISDLRRNMQKGVTRRKIFREKAQEMRKYCPRHNLRFCQSCYPELQRPFI